MVEHKRQGGAKASNSVGKYLSYAQRTYLSIYNAILFIMFSKVFISLTMKLVGQSLSLNTITDLAQTIKVLTFIQLLESIHPMLGLVPGGPFMPLMQTMGRMLVNHFLSEPKILEDSCYSTHYLFLVWSCIELFRYSFYALRVHKIDVYLITWCRYTLFLPLYPLGGLLESIVLIMAIDFYQKTNSYSISLPNSLNFSFSLPIMLKIYIYCLLGPAIGSLMKYMWLQRRKQLKAQQICKPIHNRIQ